MICDPAPFVILLGVSRSILCHLRYWLYKTGQVVNMLINLLQISQSYNKPLQRPTFSVEKNYSS